MSELKVRQKLRMGSLYQCFYQYVQLKGDQHYAVVVINWGAPDAWSSANYLPHHWPTTLIAPPLKLWYSWEYKVEVAIKSAKVW